MKRVVMASSLAVAVLAIPTEVWYIVRQRDAANEASRMQSEVVADAGEVGRRLGAVVTSRLEGARETENERDARAGAEPCPRYARRALLRSKSRRQQALGLGEQQAPRYSPGGAAGRRRFGYQPKVGPK